MECNQCPLTKYDCYYLTDMINRDKKKQSKWYNKLIKTIKYKLYIWNH